MTESLMIGNTKGGTGKSLITLFVAHGLRIHFPNKNVYIIDLDHQGTISNLTLKGRYKEEEGKDIGTYLKNLTPITVNEFVPTDIEGLYLVPNHGNVDSDFFIGDVPKGMQIEALKNIMENFDGDGFVIYDMPGSNGNNFLNIIKIVEHIIILTTLGAEDIDPIPEFIKYIEINKKTNSKLKAQGILINKFSKTAKAFNRRQLAELKVKNKTNLPIFDTKISNSTQISSSTSFNKTIFEYLKEDEQHYILFDNLIKEIINKIFPHLCQE
jgi:cellulose biosynthesis protein BcsQ